MWDDINSFKMDELSSRNVIFREEGDFERMLSIKTARVVDEFQMKRPLFFQHLRLLQVQNTW